MTAYPIKREPLEHKLIGDIVKEYPETTEVLKKYFGENCLTRASLKIKTLEIACILFRVFYLMLTPIACFKKLRRSKIDRHE